MKEEIGATILNGMEITFFIAMYLLAVAGVIVFFLREVYNSIKHDNRTPDKFNFKTMLKMSAIRFVLGLIIIAISIIYFGEMSQLVFQIAEPLELNGFVAFALGMSIDRVIDGVLGYGKDGKILIEKQMKR